MTPMPPAGEPVYLTLVEVAKLLRRSTRSVYRLAKEDPSMPMLKLSGALLFHRERLEKWLRACEQGPARPSSKLLRADALGEGSGAQVADPPTGAGASRQPVPLATGSCAPLCAPRAKKRPADGR